MTGLLRAELLRFFGTRLWMINLGAAVLSGLGLIGLLVLIGPENADPPMPGLDTPEGVGALLGITQVTLFIPATLGTFSVTSEFRHGTIGTTFLSEPRRGRVLLAKLITQAAVGLGYGIVLTGGIGLALTGAALRQPEPLGMPPIAILATLVQLALAAAVYSLLGVAIGALVRHQIAAIVAVLGYFYLVETLLMIIPGVNQLYGWLPGGATAALTHSTWLSESLADQTSVGAATLLPVWAGGLLLVGYAAAASLAAVALPLRRDIT